jgi:hypothetical protein
MEGDTLVIETANYSAGVLNQYVETPGQPTKGLAALGGAHVGREDWTSMRRASGSSSRSTSRDPEFFTQALQSARRRSTRRAISVDTVQSARRRRTRARFAIDVVELRRRATRDTEPMI